MTASERLRELYGKLDNLRTEFIFSGSEGIATELEFRLCAALHQLGAAAYQIAELSRLQQEIENKIDSAAV